MSEKNAAIIFVVLLLIFLIIAVALCELAIRIHRDRSTEQFKTSAGYCLARNKPANCLDRGSK